MLIPTVQVVAKDERPTLSNMGGEVEAFTKLFQTCWQPKSEDRPSMSEIVTILNNFE